MTTGTSAAVTWNLSNTSERRIVVEIDIEYGCPLRERNSLIACQRNCPTQEAPTSPKRARSVRLGEIKARIKNFAELGIALHQFCKHPRLTSHYFPPSRIRARTKLPPPESILHRP